jgi:hypothetical protein
MFKNKSHFIQPLRIALFCASALMLSTALAEDGSNLSALRAPVSSTAQPDHSTGQPAMDEDGGNLSELRALPANNSDHEQVSLAKITGQPAMDEDGGNLSELRAQQVTKSGYNQ